jgi:hypothetical protein
MATTNKVIVGIDDQIIELKGEEKEAFLADKKTIQDSNALLESEAQAKKQARIDAITKLGQASGLTTEEIESILNI